MEQVNKAEMRACVDALFERGAFSGVSVFAFGHCNATEETIDHLFEKGVAVEGILDNSEAKQGSSYRAVPIVPPSLIRNHLAGSIVLVATRFFEPMAAQLRGLGYGGEIVKVVDYNSFAEYSLSDATIERKTARMERGAETLGEIRKRYPFQYLVVCPNRALGDVYWALAFLPAWRKKHGVGEFAAVVIGEGCRQVAEMFGTKNIVTLERTEMDEFVQALIFTREENCIIAHHDRPYTDNIIRYLDRHFLSFIDYYRCAVYGLPRETAPVDPTNLRDYPDDGTLVKGRSVILAPHAKSVTQPRAVFWEELADEWRGRGYLVCTSVNGGEPPVAGTVPLSLPLDRMAAAAEFAGAFIGLRSGLCEVVHAANCRKIVVFPEGFYSTTPHRIKDFFELPGWESVLQWKAQ